MEGPAQYKVLVIGLDGATFDLMLPWIDEGRLPNLGRLLRDGAWSRLRSTIPPITPCAWSSFMTGKNPGKHGLFDFVEPTPGGRGFRFTNASSRCGETLWGCLSRHERRVGVVNVPMTFPPEPVNGYMLSGLDTPHEHSAYSHPPALRDELRQAGIPYRVDLRHLGDMRTDARRDRRIQDLREMEAIRTDAAAYLDAKYPADFRMVVYIATDQVQHHFWHYMDPRHDKHDPQGAKKYGNVIADTYVHIDNLVGKLLADIDDDTIVVVMSDHGFGPTSNMRVRPNQALAQKGLLKFSEERRAGRLKRMVGGLLDRVVRSTLSAGMKSWLAGMFPRLRVWFETLDDAKLDWNQTVAFANETFQSSPSVWINRESAATETLRVDGQPSEAALGKVEVALKSLKDPQTGRPAISNVYRTRDLYTGSFSAAAPDLLLSWWEDGFLLDQSQPQGTSETNVERSSRPIVGGVEFAGSHRLDGVCILHGGPVRRGLKFSGAEITDVTPTILYLMGLPIPDDMDGRPLLAAIDPDYVAATPPRFENADGSLNEPNPNADAGMSEEEQRMVAQRLQALGYIA